MISASDSLVLFIECAADPLAILSSSVILDLDLR